MSPADIQEKFLIINRNRRQSSAKSESGLRYVMGRKGLGKLAGFGTAEKNYNSFQAKKETFCHRVHNGLRED